VAGGHVAASVMLHGASTFVGCDRVSSGTATCSGFKGLIRGNAKAAFGSGVFARSVFKGSIRSSSKATSGHSAMRASIAGGRHARMHIAVTDTPVGIAGVI